MQLALTTDGDLDVAGGRRRFITGYDASKQAWRVSSRLFRAEWFLNRAAGFPWTQVVFVDRPSVLLIRAKLHEMALAIPGVVEVLGIEITQDRASRKLGGKVDARFDNGDVRRFSIYNPVIDLDGAP